VSSSLVVHKTPNVLLVLMSFPFMVALSAILIPLHFGGWIGIFLAWKAWARWVFGEAPECRSTK
jgi:hypothetical protein